MSFKEVKELRQAGKLDEALQMANQALESEPDNIWNKRATAWVYYDYLKKHSQPELFDAFKEKLINIRELQLPEDEKMVFDNCAWQIGSMVFGLQKAEPVDYGKINELFENIKDFHFTKPSAAYSVIYKAFHKGYQNWSKYLQFADWWNFENFRSEDYSAEEFNGKKIMAIAEQAYIAYSKKLLEGEATDPLGINKEVNLDKVQAFLPKLDKIVEKHPEYQYPAYFKAKLLLLIGNGKNVLSAFIPFAKQKRNDFWVWELMADIFQQDSEVKFACYCKALSLKTPEDFLVKIRQSFASMLVEKKMFPEAKSEIEKIVKVRFEHQWKLPNQITEWMDQEWYKSTKSTENNKELYAKYIRSAEEILFQDVPEEIIVVEFVNQNKKILNFVKSKSKFGFFNYSGQIEHPQIGDVLKVQFNGEGKEGFHKVLTAKKASGEELTDAKKQFEGQLRLVSPQNFGFVDDVFIDPKLIQYYDVSAGKMLKGKAILSFNKKKNEWGWKAIELL